MDQNIWVTFPHVLIFFPLLAGLVTFLFKKDANVKSWALFSSIITLCISLFSLYYANNKALSGLVFNYEWMKHIGASFSVSLDGMGRMLTLLTAISFPIIFVATYNTQYKNANIFYGLLLLTQAGLMGVFVAADALVFYFFWELAIIPVYFLCSRWGGEKRVQATFKFFIYTFTGSLLMLFGIVYMYLQTPAIHDNAGALISEHSFSMNYFYSVQLSSIEQNWLFWLFFIAFAIKMPVFPFHTWQPDTYEQSPTAVTMVLSGVMVKMGLFGLIRWLLPMFPEAVAKFDNIVIILSITGIVYASLLATRQDDLKRLVAYSSIAHIGLMCAAIFTTKEIGLEGVMIQMFNHGINIIGLWIAIEMIEKQLGVRKISELGGVAQKAPILTIMFVVIAFANIALPLTNAFVGEFMMFSGLFTLNVWFATIALLSIILAAMYTLNMVQKVLYGQANLLTGKMKEISVNERIALSIVVVAIFLMGIYQQPLFDLTKDTVTDIITRFK
jgi:NADH-quinone oxidoreductase subunit M